MLKKMLRIFDIARFPLYQGSYLGFISAEAVIQKNSNWIEAFARINLKKAYAGITSFSMILLFLFSYTTFAEDKEKGVPRFASLKSNHVNARRGPGIGYPIEWVFISRSEPVKVVAEFEQWRKVEDISGLVGWIHSSVLSPKRSVVIVSKDPIELRKSSDRTSRIIAKLENGLRCNFDKIRNGWCKVKCKGYKGWVESSYIWGISKSEAVNE